MNICDCCKKVIRYQVVMRYTFGLHCDGKPVKDGYACYEIDLCESCRKKITGDHGGARILKWWKELCGEVERPAGSDPIPEIK